MAGTPSEMLEHGFEGLECEAILSAIRRYRGNLTQSAHALRIARSTLYLKIRKYGLEDQPARWRALRYPTLLQDGSALER